MRYCQNCGEKPASIVVKTSVAGQEKDLCLCNECAERLGLSGERTNPEEYQQILFAERTEVVCPNCGTRETDFEATGYAGCSVCYYVFKNAAKNCEKWHGSAKHVGKVSESQVLSKTRLGTIMLRLRSASLAGDVNQIKAIKQELKMLEASNAKK